MIVMAREEVRCQVCDQFVTYMVSLFMSRGAGANPLLSSALHNQSLCQTGSSPQRQQECDVSMMRDV